MPIVDDDGALAGVMTERTLARRYIRESREADEPVRRRRLGGGDRRGHRGQAGGRRGARDRRARVGAGHGRRVAAGRHRRGRRRRRRRPRPTPSAARSSSASRCWSRATARVPSDEVLALAREHGTTVVSSPLDSYVTSRMVTLSAPCRALMNAEPLTVRPDDLLSDVAEEINAMDYRAAIAVDGRRRPVGLITHAELADPEPRRVLLVDHAEEAQSVARRRAGRDRRDPRPPPHRLDRDEGPGHRDLRPGRLDRHAGRRALPPERHGAHARRRRPCCSGRCCRTP